MKDNSLAWPDPFRPGAYRLEIISAGLQSISAWAKRVWPRETRRITRTTATWTEEFKIIDVDFGCIKICKFLMVAT